MNIQSLEDLIQFPIATSPEDLRERISAVFLLINRGFPASNLAYAESLVDVISYQSYAGYPPEESELQILDWIALTYDETDLDYADAVSTLYANFRSKRAHMELFSRIGDAKSEHVKELLKEALNEFQPIT